MVVRAGYGIAFDPISTFQVTSIATAVPGQTYTCSSTLGSTGAADHHSGLRFGSQYSPGRRLPQRTAACPTAKPSSFLTPPLQLQNNAPAARVFDPQLKLPTVHMWNLTLQRELPGGYIVSAGYVGRSGERLYRTWDANQIDAGADSALVPGDAEEHAPSAAAGRMARWRTETRARAPPRCRSSSREF